ncbi:MAG: phosphonate ABC transporter ATP-binding protein [Deltaproteobacteria bacterium GWA2_57_13]|nr:MAG: phosphonate ABC transporter ATP-binding protein [Deltaproteobacteria bacterium GWA2_57_13]OGQ52710.1 MAG: phosphonate ABC transporter ATP-binding protein [Deltaproteobacteria bacterium RIFCSPLOWO2_02_FULL_57_26]OGQ83576.1 MAG: phosphonate ABC transporter ATP-binding protein [Deltaproteobacteria bacterium RIFCSPLOWO2_12_FULL_57_22]
MTILEVRNLRKAFGASAEVLRGIRLKVDRGEFLGIIGLSGAGKSTLLRCINRLIEPTSGEILVPRSIFDPEGDGLGLDVCKLDWHELRLLRRRVGMIFQQFNIVKRLSVIENVLAGGLGYQSSWTSCLRLFSRGEKRRALTNLKRVGLLEHAYKRADELSGGEQQRVAIARVLMQKPAIILADEPVSNLDPRLSRVILDILKGICLEDGITALVSLHTLDLTRQYADRIVGLREGRVYFDALTVRWTEEMVEKIYEGSGSELV